MRYQEAMTMTDADEPRGAAFPGLGDFRSR